MKMKRKMKQIISGLLAAVTIFSGAVSPLTASAAETDPKEKKPPVYEEVKDQLNEDEVVRRMTMQWRSAVILMWLSISQGLTLLTTTK